MGIIETISAPTSLRDTPFLNLAGDGLGKLSWGWHMSHVLTDASPLAFVGDLFPSTFVRDEAEERKFWQKPSAFWSLLSAHKYLVEQE